MRFVDEARIKVKAGDGGPGITAWRREKFVPMGGPAGGNGGKGGDVIFIAKEGMNSLLDLKQQSLLEAAPGLKGQSKNQTGRNGKDRIVTVPVGTEIIDSNGEETTRFDLTAHDQEVLICRGGDGGFGNAHFKSQYNKAPDRATLGFKGEEREIVLTLKLMADVGLLGFPNAGKSTLLSHLSNAKPKVAEYPFTTIKPMVGVVEVDLSRTMIMADIPGLIEGASTGAGLGFRFLRHLERVRVLCHLIDGSDETDLMTRFNTINRELEIYSDKLAALPQVVVINKIDVLDDEQRNRVDEFVSGITARGITPVLISAVAGTGLQELKDVLYAAIDVVREATEDVVVSKFDPTKNLY